MNVTNQQTLQAYWEIHCLYMIFGMNPVKSEHIYIFACYSASCPLILLHSGRRRGAFLGEVHPPLSLALVSPPPPKMHWRNHGRVLSPGLPGRLARLAVEGSHAPAAAAARHCLLARIQPLPSAQGDVFSSIGDESH